MISRWNWVIGLLTRRLWFKAAIYGVVAVATALFAALASPWVPESVSSIFGADSVGDVLKILASSMLAVATFSLGTMVSAFSAAASTATPRASLLLVEDSTSQNVLSTFIGAFIFGLVGLIALNSHFYGEGGRAILFFVTIGVIAITLATFFRWIDYLSHLGRLGETIDKVEAAAAKAMRARCRSPFLGGRRALALPLKAFPIKIDTFGYVQHLDTGLLNDVAAKAGGAVHVVRLPGAFVDPSEPVGWTTWKPSEDQRKELTEAFLIGKARSFDQDPRFGMIVLSEIASRALSPGINDPGTAIDIIGRVVRMMSIWSESLGEKAGEVEYHNVFVPPISTSDLFDDVFTPIARDGAGTVEVATRLQKALRILARMDKGDISENAIRHSRLAAKRSAAALELMEDKTAIETLADDVGSAIVISRNN